MDTVKCTICNRPTTNTALCVACWRPMQVCEQCEETEQIDHGDCRTVREQEIEEEDWRLDR